MALLKPLWMQADAASGAGSTDYPLGQDRLGLLGSIFSRTGVLDLLAGHLRVTQRGAGANLSVDVALGRCVIAAGDGGMYLCTSTSTVNVSTPAGSRAYRIIARVRDKQAFGESASTWSVEAIFAAGSTPPATPVRAISLGTFTTTSSTTQVTTAMVTDTRTRSTVGTLAQTGTWGLNGFTPTYPPYDVWGFDATRPLTWMKTSDGWVMLSGWVSRMKETSSVTSSQWWHWDRQGGTNGLGMNATPVLPPEIRPTGYRDVATITSNGDVGLVVQPNGCLAYHFYYDTTLSADAGNRFWCSFDNIKYRVQPG